MTNFTSSNPSIDAALSATGQYGVMSRFGAWRLATGTNGLTTCGGISGLRVPAPITIPAVGAGVAGYCLTMNDVYPSLASQNFTVLEYALGTITLSGNVFSGSASMPTKTVLGTSLTTASNIAFLVVTTTGTATTPTITITYTDQDGNTGKTATLVLPTSPFVNTAFFINPHLAGNGTGIRTVTNISSSVTTGALVMKVYGCLILGHSNTSSPSANHGSVEPAVTPTLPMYLCEAGDTVNIYSTAATAGSRDIYACLAFTPEPT